MFVRWSARSTGSFLSGVLGEVKGELVEVPELGWVFDLLLQCVTPPLSSSQPPSLPTSLPPSLTPSLPPSLEQEDLKESDRALMDIFKLLQGDVVELTDICRDIGSKKSIRLSSDWSQRNSVDSIPDFELPRQTSLRWSQTEPVESLELSLSYSSGSSSNHDLESTLESSAHSSGSSRGEREAVAPIRQLQPSLSPAEVSRAGVSSRIQLGRAQSAKVAPAPPARVPYSKGVKVLPVSSSVSAVANTVPMANLVRSTSLRPSTAAFGGSGVTNGCVRVRAKEAEEVTMRKLDTSRATVDDSVFTELKPSTSNHSGSDSLMGPSVPWVPGVPRIPGVPWFLCVPWVPGVPSVPGVP